MRPTPKKNRQPAGNAGFTLVELLVVISIILVMMGIVVPTLGGLLKAKGVSGAMNEVTGMIELARTEAMAKRTYVWLGFYNPNDPNHPAGSANSQIWLVAARSLDGTPNLTGTNLRVIGRVHKLDNMTLTNQAGLSTKTQSLLGSAGVAASNAPAVYDPAYAVTAPPQNLLPGSSALVSLFITFTPQGQAILTPDPSTATPPTPFTNRILIGLRKTAGTTILPNDADSVALILYGGTGAVGVFRP